MGPAAAACQSGRVDVPGLIAVATVLVVGVAAGMWRRSTDGRFRTVAGGPPVAVDDAATAPAAGTGPGATAAVPGTGPATAAVPGAGPGATAAAAETGAGATRAGGAREGAAEVADAEPTGADRIPPDLLSALGVPPGQVTLLQFSSAFCAPCRAVRRVSSEVAGMVSGVAHVEVDAESHLEAVRALGIWKTPTLLVVGPDGRVAKRATGVPGKPQLIAAVAELLPPR